MEIILLCTMLTVPLWLIWRNVFKKRITKTGKRRFITILATAVSAPILYILIAALYFFVITYYPNRDFDKAEWLKNKDTRYEYSHNIIESKLLIGKTKAQVKAILGDVGNSDAKDVWYYDLGFRPEPFNIDPDTLTIEFKNGRVIEVSQLEG